MMIQTSLFRKSRRRIVYKCFCDLNWYESKATILRQNCISENDIYNKVSEVYSFWPQNKLCEISEHCFCSQNTFLRYKAASVQWSANLK